MKKKKMFIQILASYLVILIIPILILGAVVVNFFFKEYNAELLANRMDNLVGFQLSTDSIINRLSASAYEMFRSKEFTTRHLREGYGNFLDIAGRLSNNSFTNDFIFGAYYINSDLKQVITTQTAYSYEGFAEYQESYDVPLGEMEDLLIANRRSYWLPTQKVGPSGREALTFVVTNKVGSKRGTAAVFFQINPGNLRELAGKLNGEKTSTVIADYDGTLLYASNPELAEKEWRHWLKSPRRRSGEAVTLNIEGDTYVVIQLQSNQSPLMYANIIPYHEIMQPIEANSRIFIIGLLAISLISVAFISYFMKINYTPIRSISKLAASFFGENREAMGELESTRVALITMNERQTVLMRERLTLRLMRGGFSSLEELEREGAPYNYRLSGPLFRVVVFRIESSDNPLDITLYQEITDLIEDSISVYTAAVAINYSENDTVYLVISGEADELQGLSEKYKQIKNVIEHTFGISLSVGVSNVEPIETIVDATAQATAASNYNFVKGKGSITFYMELDGVKTGKQLEYPNRTLEALHNAILQGESERAEFAMNTLTKHIQDSRSFFYGTCLAYDILNTAMRAMREVSYETNSFEDIPISGKNAPRSIDEIIEIVGSITDKIVGAMSRREDAGTPVIHMNHLEQIMQYILEQYMDEDFSVKTLAARFEMSVSNLSHFFKKNTGQTVSEYISLLRFEKAKELLRNTDMNLQDISLRCGYLHLSTFMRQFKQRAGCTPANYRAKQRPLMGCRVESPETGLPKLT